MPTIPSRVSNRLVTTIKRFQSVLSSAKTRDVNESDTVIIVTDMLSEILGYDKYSEITSEHAIRGTYCDLATLLEGRVQMLVEAKAVGIELKEAHVKQAVDYAANKGIDWVLLTNGVIWRVYKVTFAKPIDQELVFEIDFLTFDTKDDALLEFVYVLTKEGWVKEGLTALHAQRQMLSKFTIAALTISEPILDVMRRELRRLCPDVRIQNEQIEQVLLHEVLKREVVDGDKAEEARKKISRAVNKYSRARSDKTPTDQNVKLAAIAPLITSQIPAPAAGTVPQPPEV
jgi:predicted type IV restriction endonuclease